MKKIFRALLVVSLLLVTLVGFATTAHDEAKTDNVTVVDNYIDDITSYDVDSKKNLSVEDYYFKVVTNREEISEEAFYALENGPTCFVDMGHWGYLSVIGHSDGTVTISSYYPTGQLKQRYQGSQADGEYLCSGENK